MGVNWRQQYGDNFAQGCMIEIKFDYIGHLGLQAVPGIRHSNTMVVVLIGAENMDYISKWGISFQRLLSNGDFMILCIKNVGFQTTTSVVQFLNDNCIPQNGKYGSRYPNEPSIFNDCWSMTTLFFLRFTRVGHLGFQAVAVVIPFWNNDSWIPYGLKYWFIHQNQVSMWRSKEDISDLILTLSIS